jgi:probable HAF family extracellular repeat protein
MGRFTTALLAASLVSTGVAAQEYTLIDIGTLGGPGSYAAAVSNDGTVVGCADVLPSGAHAFAWKNGAMRDLGLASDATEGSSCALAVNDRGVIAGRSATREIVVWNGRSVERLGVQGEVGGINSAGVLVGSYETGGLSRAFVYRNGAITPIGSEGEYSHAAAINSRDQVAGSASGRAFIYESGAIRFLEATAARDLNDVGVVVGQAASAYGQPFAFVYRGGAIEALPAPSYSTAKAVNLRGQVVGSGEGVYGWVVDNGRYTRLSDLPAMAQKGWRHPEPTGINDRGWIVGTASDADGNLRAFLLVPRQLTKPLRRLR